MIYNIAIIGAGVIGGMIARELSKFNLSVILLEKENDVSRGASKANSGIIHGGFDPEPGTLKAKLNSSGIKRLYKAANELNVPHKKNGSLVCAFCDEEDEIIRELYNRGITNNIENLRVLTGEEARELEPELSGEITSALHIPDAGIICPYQLTIAAIGNAMDNGVSLKCNFEVSNIERKNNKFKITSHYGDYVEAEFIINCAGAYGDKISAFIGDDSFNIIPRAGEYLLLDKCEGCRVTHTIFQAPTKDGKGILVSPTVDGNLLTGPTATPVDSPELAATTEEGLKNVRVSSLKSVPGIDFRQVITTFSGIRASEKAGDFIIGFSEKSNKFLNVAAIDSPGLTCCVSIAEYVVSLLRDTTLTLEVKTDWNGKRQDVHFFAKMSDKEKSEYIKRNPDYGKIICRCEGISEGEIRDAIKTNPPACDIDGIKQRTRSGMGRCQGGFCLPGVMKIISQENSIPIENVTKNGKNSHFLQNKI